MEYWFNKAITQNCFCGTDVVPLVPRTTGICSTYVVLPSMEGLKDGKPKALEVSGEE